MEQSIRKKFHQVKKKNKINNQLHNFELFWNQITNQDRVKFYSNWVIQLLRAIQILKKPSYKLQPQSLTIQDQIYLRKISLFNSPTSIRAKLTPTKLTLNSRKSKQYQLKQYEIRIAPKIMNGSKTSWGWVLRPISKYGKTLHFQVYSQSTFDQWIYALTVNINNQRVQYFLNIIKNQRQNPGQYLNNVISNKYNNNQYQKTLTQIIIDKQMKINQQKNQGSDSQQFQSIQNSEQENYNRSNFIQNQNGESNPNIFKRLIPNHKALQKFQQIYKKSILLLSDKQYQIYQLQKQQNQTNSLFKLFIKLPYSKKQAFKILTNSNTQNIWNNDIQNITVKTKIATQNSALIYQKYKSLGLMYRQRDFLYLRHCFTIKNIQTDVVYIVDKSIDSIHHPPFMTFVRGQKQLIWSISQLQKNNQCNLIVQGWINGGGYMNYNQNKQMTIKFFKKIIDLKNKKYQLSNINDQSLFFKQQWQVDFQLYQYQQQQNNNFIKINKQQLNQQIQHKQIQQFIKRTQQQQKYIQKNQQKYSKNQIDQNQLLQKFIPKFFDNNKFVIGQIQYLNKKHLIYPKQKQNKSNYFPHFRGHHLWKGQWNINNIIGGLTYIDQQKMKQQKKVLTYIIKRIGKNIFSGKGILNISLPVDIFCQESNIQKLASSFGYFPTFLQKASKQENPLQQIKYIVAAGIPSSLIYLGIQKPFNPILGQTYQGWMDGCPIYFQQISHHPPIAAFFMKGRGYTVSGTVQAKMDLSINSGTGNNQGVFTIQFDNGNKFYYTTPAGMLQGLTYGQRKLNFIGKSYYWNNKGIFLQIQYNPQQKKKNFFASNKSEGDNKMIDYFEGTIKQFAFQSIKQVCFKQIQNKLIPIVPKQSPKSQPIKTYQKIYGRWNKYIKFNDQILFDVDNTRYHKLKDYQFPLPSHSNYRQDIVYRRKNDFVTSQQFKQVLQQKQRNDRKLRAKIKNKQK